MAKNNKKTMVEELENEVKEVEVISEATIEDDNEYEELSIEERIINIEKKTNTNLVLNVIILVVAILSLVIAVAGGNDNKTFANNETTDTTNQEETSSYDTSKFSEIAAADIKDLSNGKSIVVWIGRQGCGWCSYFAPVMEEVSSSVGFTPYYIDLGKIVDFSQTQAVITDGTAWDTLTSLSGSGSWATFASENMGGTPLILVIKNNKVVGGQNGYSDADTLKSALKEAGIK